MHKEDFSWLTFYNYRLKVRKQFPSVWCIKVRKKHQQIVLKELADGNSILDVGAGERYLPSKLKRLNPAKRIAYKSMDIDKTQKHDYYSLDEIQEKFDMITFLEVIEHMQFSDGMKTLKKFRELLKPSGKLVISTPNIHHPSVFFWDSNHVTPYRYDVLGAALLINGFKIRNIYRIYNDQFLRRFLRIYIMYRLHRYLDVDFARQILAVAQLQEGNGKESIC